jgi:hypothetical protein
LLRGSLAHAEDVLGSVYPHAAKVARIDLPGLKPGGDISDWLQEHTPSELWELIKNAQMWQPASATPAPLDPAVKDFGLISMADVLTRPAAPVDWLWKDRLPAGTVNMVVSKPKVGKSTFARNLALAVARGRALFGLPVKRGKVVYLHLEELIDHVVADFRAMGADKTVGIEFLDSATMQLVVQLVKTKKPSLLIIDPLFRLIQVKDEKAYAEGYKALGPLIDAARETGTCILCLHHSSKSVKTDAIDAPIGSTAYGGSVSTLLVMNTTDRGRTIKTVQRVGPSLEETILNFDPATRLLTLGGSRDEAEVQDLKDKILAFLKTHPSSTEEEIDEAVEGKTTHKRKALRGLRDEEKITWRGSGRRGDPYRYSKARAGRSINA